MVHAHYLQVLWACAIVFMIARLVFWFGYRRHPLFRAPGMSATAYLNLGMILYVLYGNRVSRRRNGATGSRCSAPAAC